MRLICAALLFLALWAVLPPTRVEAQPGPVVPEEINQQAAKLEAELGKFKDSSEEAVPVMLELIKLYHAHGRVFGLVNVGERFINHHPQHASARDVLLQLIDGLLATSRNKELSSACRQFLTRFPKDAECGRVEQVLVQALEQLEDRPRLADACAAVWARQGDTPLGRQMVARAMLLYSQVGTRESIVHAAQLADQALDRIPAGLAIEQLGMQGVYEWRRLGEWGKANGLSLKMLSKGVPVTPSVQRTLLIYVAEQYANQNQRTNAAEYYRKARGISDSWDVHSRLITELHNAAAPTADIENLVNEYFQKYPDRPDRFNLRNLVALACLRANDKPRALQIFAEILPNDATYGATYVQQFPIEPAQLAQAEATLVQALSQNTAQAGVLRYVLAFEVYRDRLKDLPKAKATAREFLRSSPTNDGYSQQIIYWLLYNAADDDEFNSDLDLVLKTRLDWFSYSNLRAYLPGWIQEARNNKDVRARAQQAKQKLDEQDASAAVKEMLAAEQNNKPGMEARGKLLATDAQGKLNDAQAHHYFYNHGYWLYANGVKEQQAQSPEVFQRYVARFPKDVNAVFYWLLTASNYGTPEQCRAAVTHQLTLPAGGNIQNTQWYYLMLGADKTNDPALVKQAFDWIVQAQQKTGPEPSYAYFIGDVLEKHKFAAEAMDYWKRSLALNPDGYESHACAQRLASHFKDAERTAFLQSLQKPSYYAGTYAEWLADDALKANNLDLFEKTLRDALLVRNERPLSGVAFDEYPPQTWLDQTRANKELPIAAKVRIFTVLRDMKIGRPSAAAALALLEFAPPAELTPMKRLLAWQEATLQVRNDANDWDRLMPYAQAALAQKDYLAAASLLTGMLSNIPSVDNPRKQAARDLVTQCYTRIGGVGLTIDESSPIAPLLQAALYLRLGDERLAFETYSANLKLFDEHRTEVPTDLLLFVCESHLAAGGDVNLTRVEETLTSWLVKFNDLKEVEDQTKASVRLLLARSYYKAQRYDVARGEFTTVLNLYPTSKAAIEAEFGIGEAFMAQKVYDQAEQVFEKLAANRDRDVVIRAEFLRGVLAHRRGDLDQARDIFRAVLDRVPSIELANQALFNLSEVYGAEQRYLDQLELLRTIGRLGRTSKRFHAPGEPLSIVVQDSDLGISRGHSKIPVKVITEPGGDEETIYLFSGGAGKGLFRADLETSLGQPAKNDKVLQLSGRDVVRCDYPAEFKAEFKNAPLSDVEIRIASNARFEASSGKIIDRDKETLSQRLEREAREQDASDQRLSQGRPVNQVKPGNAVYLRVQDADKDLTPQPDTVVVKLTAASGDQVQVKLKESGAHTGIFEGTAPTADLPSGALASDTAIEHSPLMAIDQNLDSVWLSEPDGATPKWLSVDMKDVHEVSRVSFSTPNPAQRAPVRGELFGSNDGRFWFRMASHPAIPAALPVAGEAGRMTQRVYAGNFTGIEKWEDVVALTKNRKPIEEGQVDTLQWGRSEDADEARQPFAVVWHGQLVQPRTGPARVLVYGTRTALAVDGRLELKPDYGNRHVDLWLEAGTHELTIFAATPEARYPLSALWTRSEQNRRDMALVPFRPTDFDLDNPAARPAIVRKPALMTVADGTWHFQFQPIELRHVKFVINEYLGEAVAINHVEVGGLDEDEVYVPTKADILSLANNDVLEIAAGDKITASYSDELNQNATGGNQLLTSELTATYYDAWITPIAYDFERLPNGQINTIPKQLIRIDPGERVIVQIVDYDMDRSDKADTVTLQVAVNDGPPVEFTAQETQPFSGVFTKEIDTSSTVEAGKLKVTPGDRLYCTYVDAQNTYPGHAAPREATVYVNQPSDARIRIVETRMVRPPADSAQLPQVVYLPLDSKKPSSHVAFEAPLTIEVYDRDAARDSKSSVIVTLTTTDGAKIDVECVVSPLASGIADSPYYNDNWALEDGRFVGQVVMQLGSQSSPDIVPITLSMPRNLIGRGVLPEEKGKRQSEVLVTRVLNLSGKDRIVATYKDQFRTKGPAKLVTAEGRLIANGTLAAMDRDYNKEVQNLHVGEKLFLMVNDADRDASDERDRVQVLLTTDKGDRETVELEETLIHSGVFTGSVTLKPSQQPKPGDLKPADPVLESDFGDLVHVEYLDSAASTESGSLTLKKDLPVVIGTDGLVYAFSKTFNNEQLAVETKFHIAESYFELFKSHKTLGRVEEQKEDLRSGRRVLKEVMEDYPSPKYVPRIAYLSGQFAQELQQWDEAIESYRLIVRQYPEHSLAPDAQYKLAQCYEDANRFDEALEAYVTLAATYPKSPLIATVMIRINDHFYKNKAYDVAAQVGQKFLEKFEGHQYAPRMAFRVGQCYYKAEQFAKAGDAFDKFARTFPEDDLRPDSMFWAGESFRMAKNYRQAFIRYNKTHWDHPTSEAAKYARGRLQLPDMQSLYEQEATALENMQDK